MTMALPETTEPYHGLVPLDSPAKILPEDRRLYQRFIDPATPAELTSVHLGENVVVPWYPAPYPAEYVCRSDLYICDQCLCYRSSELASKRHKLKCMQRYPPGAEIYRHDGLSLFEVDGSKEPVYCQNLCLLAKFFLDTKSLYYDVEPFLYYVLVRCDKAGSHLLGYFSKLKVFSGTSPGPVNSLSCIVVVPCFQGKGYGQLLISLSYGLVRLQKTTGTPEKPLSRHGASSFTAYWKGALCRELDSLLNAGTGAASVRTLSNNTGIAAEDVVAVLEELGFLKYGKLVVDDFQLSRHLALKSREFRWDHLLWVPYRE